MRKIFLLTTVLVFSSFKAWGFPQSQLINRSELKQLAQNMGDRTDEEGAEYILLGQYPVYGNIEKIVAENSAFQNQKVCKTAFRINVLAKKYKHNELSGGAWRKYRKFLKVQKAKLQNLKSITNNLPDSSPCEITLNGSKGSADMLAVFLFDLSETQKLRGRVFPDFQTSNQWEQSIALGQTIPGNGDVRGMSFSLYAGPSIEKGSSQWSYFSVNGTQFQEVATATFDFKY